VTAVRNSLDLAARVERAGYARLWFGEHHLNPGVIGYSPAVTIALAGAVTSTIRLGAGAVLAGHRTPLSVAEEFGLLEAAFPGRIDLGLGRAGLRKPDTQRGRDEVSVASETGTARQDRYTGEGLLLPKQPDLSALLGSPRFTAQRSLLNQPGAQPGTYAQYVEDLVELFHDRTVVDSLPVTGATPQTNLPQIWVLGSSAGESSEIAGRRGLRFGANYHVAPSHVTDAVEHYRQAFQPGADLKTPWVIVSAEVLVADTETEAQHLAAGYDLWVHSIRSGQGAIYYPSPEQALAEPLPESEYPLVADRLKTRFVGTAEQVVHHLEVLQRATGADELLISSITHDHERRARSFELLAQAWQATEADPSARRVSATTYIA
jgi:alkanesulfonate monooxygenase SsuD/methylene tetrahydromethanopterin reductase-like flavin-dependent oxidoreductase (luciferase family)